MKRMLSSLSLCCILAAGGPSKHVDPTTGIGGHAHTFPGPLAPFGMVQVGPDTRLTGWDGCSGYHDNDRVIYGFSHTHLSGTGCSDYGDILLLPATGPVKLKTGYRGINDVIRPHDPAGYGSHFRKETEKAAAGYYAVELDDYGVRAELTATPRVGFHRYTFHKAGASHLLLDLTHRDEVIESGLKVVNDREVEGFRRAKAWSADKRWYFVARFSRPLKAEIALDDQIQAGLREAKGRNVKLVLHATTKEGEVIQVKVGLSPTSIEGARRNLDAEVKGWDFEAVKAQTERAWDNELSRIEVKGGRPEDLRTFYTAMYHSMIHPSLAMDVDGSYLGRDFKVHQAKDFTYYSVFSLWDTFRALHPLLTIVDRRRSQDFVKTFLAQYQQGGRLPVWELSSNETFCMIGYHAIPVIWDAWAKGIRGYDAQLALEAMVHSAREDRAGVKEFKANGFVPSDMQPESVSKTLEFAYDDACIADMAKALGRQDLAQEFGMRSQYWKNVMDPATGFMRGRANGRWRTPFDPREVNFDYTEANSWQYSFMVPQDIEGLIRRHGGDAPFVQRLEQMFTSKEGMTGRYQVDITGLIGQYAHGNEPSHHVSYLYSYAGQPWKTQERVTQVRDTLYHNGPEGLCGNDDAGQMSAWYVFSAMGFYPVEPGSNQYVIGSPKFEQVKIHQENGHTFTVEAKGARPGAPYIQSASLNGRATTRTYFTHADLMKGGTLRLTMGDQPCTTWGAAPADRPVSRHEGPQLLTSPTVVDTPRVLNEATQVRLQVAEPGAAIHYTLDGSEPTEASPRYTEPIPVDRNLVLKMRATKPGFAPSHLSQADFTLRHHDWKLRLISEANPQYTAGGEGALIDGLRGGDDFRAGAWQGFEGKDLEAVVDFGSARPVRRAALGCLQDLGSWIFLPTEVTYFGSEDGHAWTRLGSVANPVDPKTPGPLRHDFALPLEGKSLRFLKVVATSIRTAPLWHKGAGGSAFLFADEILVD